MLLSEVGEKRFIAEFIRPLFNPEGDPDGVGDDCAAVDPAGELILLSTDRVPADLIAFKLGLLDHRGLGRYLARLNLSDIAACGGEPVGLLLNLGVPQSIDRESVEEICRGVDEVARRFYCRVLGGDLTASVELSISATSIGRAPRGQLLRRWGARPGDTLFTSRPLGLTPAAFAYFLGLRSRHPFSAPDEAQLSAQFTSLEPMVELGFALRRSMACTSCMDNTDGVGQCLTELAEASGVGFEIEEQALCVPPLVERVAGFVGTDPIALSLSGGADFSLVGTLAGHWSQSRADAQFGGLVRVVGSATTAGGVRRRSAAGEQHPVEFAPWNYWQPHSTSLAKKAAER